MLYFDYIFDKLTILVIYSSGDFRQFSQTMVQTFSIMFVSRTDLLLVQKYRYFLAKFAIPPSSQIDTLLSQLKSGLKVNWAKWGLYLV